MTATKRLTFFTVGYSPGGGDLPDRGGGPAYFAGAFRSAG